MTWFYVDDGFVDHPKVLAIPSAQRSRIIGVWLQCGIWCAKHLTDGRVPPGLPGEYRAKAADTALLVACRVRPGGAGLWEEDPETGGWVFHDWHIWQKTREQVEARRAARAAAGAAGGRASGTTRRAKKRTNDEANTKHLLRDGFDHGEADTNPSPARPVPDPKGPGAGPEGPPRPPGPAGPPPPADDAAGPVRLTGEIITVLGGLLPETAWEQLDHAAVDGLADSLAEHGWTRLTLGAALHQRGETLGRSRGAGLAMSILRDLARTPGPRTSPGCPNTCDEGWLADDGTAAKPCPHCRPSSARRVAEQRATSYDYGPRAPGAREAS